MTRNEPGPSLLEYAAQLRGAEAPAPGARIRMLAFRLGDHRIALPVLAARAIVRVTEVTRVPLAPAHVLGVTNVRGRILPVLDLKALLGWGDVSLSELSRLLLIDGQGRVLALLVDAVEDIEDIPEASLSPPPPELTDDGRSILSGVSEHDERLTYILDIDAMVRSLTSAPV